MKELICPKCGTPFQVDDNLYSAIADQVRNDLFKEELERRTAEIQKQYELDLKANAIPAEKAETERMAEKDGIIAELSLKIEQLNGLIAGYASEKDAKLAELKVEHSEALARLADEKNKEIASLEVKIAKSDSQHQLELQTVQNSNLNELHAKEQTLTMLSAQLEEAHNAAKTKELELKETYSVLIKAKDDEINRLKDYKARLSVKLVGEDLEQHCASTFAVAKSMGMYPNGTFKKDNDSATSGTKGDFIFRDYVDGQEYISVMFEMKNENEISATKQKNEQFLDKLHRDRKNKGCDYAVLVTMLEQDNPLYEQGIVDMSHEYEKMFIIRPQFLMPLLRILTNARKENLDQVHSLEQDLANAREQSLDVNKLWERLTKFSDSFNKNVAKAKDKYDTAIAGIDKVIDVLEKQISVLRTVKTNFESSEENLLRADKELSENLTIKKLTHGNPTMRKKLEAAQSELMAQSELTE